MLINNNCDYISVVNEIKKRIKAAQHRVLLSANSELFMLYWNIGVVINEYSVWGNKLSPTKNYVYILKLCAIIKG